MCDTAVPENFFDIQGYCGCDGIVEESFCTLCGDRGVAYPNETFPNIESLRGLTCELAEEAAQYVLDESYCRDELEAAREACCGPPLGARSFEDKPSFSALQQSGVDGRILGPALGLLLCFLMIA